MWQITIVEWNEPWDLGKANVIGQNVFFSSFKYGGEKTFGHEYVRHGSGQFV